VLVGSRNFERGAATATKIGSGAIPIQLDVPDLRSIAAAAEHIRREFGRLDLLVNNAAISNTRKGSSSLQEYMETTRASNACPYQKFRTPWLRLSGAASAATVVPVCGLS
jgi:NAD(P)-dependent dehydrogenase (short-subunit alcohol dehydrogenase family)